VFRGTWVHFPLILASIVIASFTRTLGFLWLALLIVIAEFLIVVSRFVFSYEQVFMGDLVRFWYAGLFLFASAYTLLHDGHVRVDVLYTNFSERGKALTNVFGSLFLGIPLCWNILIQGMSGRGSSINSPLLSFEISQSGFGMYTKYLMAAYLIIFAVSMGVQFTSFVLSNVARYQHSSSSEKTENMAI
jgi:TRAP-type mannitol/chloroaromatic compound transport system permease small subunit